MSLRENSDQQASIYGKRFGNGGGVSAAVAQCMREAGADPDKFNIEKCSGAAECKKALTLLKVGKLPADFIEGMVCDCLLYTSDAADEEDSVDIGGSRIIEKKKEEKKK